MRSITFRPESAAEIFCVCEGVRSPLKRIVTSSPSRKSRISVNFPAPKIVAGEILRNFCAAEPATLAPALSISAFASSKRAKAAF